MQNKSAKCENYDRFFFDEAVNHLCSAINSKNQAGFSENDLFNACKCLESHIGVDFTKPRNFSDSDSIDLMIKKISDKSSLYYREVSLSGEWYKKDCLSLLLFLKDGTPVITFRKRNRYRVFNPKTGEVFNINSETSEQLAGFGYYFYKKIPDKNADTLFKLISCFINKKHLKEITWVTLVGSIGGLLSVIVPYLTGVLFDSVIPGFEKSRLIQIVCAILLIKVTLSVFQLFRSTAFLRIQGKITAIFQPSLIDKLAHLPVRFFRKYTVGDLADRANGVDAISHILTGVVVETIMNTVFSSFNLILLFYYSSELAAYSILFTAVYVIIVFICYYFVIKHRRQYFKVGGIVSGICLQIIRGIKKVRITNSEMRFFSLWAKEYGKQRRESYVSGKILVFLSYLSAGFPVYVNAALFAVIFYSLKDFSQGEFIGFISAFGVFQSAVVSLSVTLASFFNIIPIYERLKPIVETKSENYGDKVSVENLSGNIKIKDLSFKYEGQTVNALSDVSFEIEQGSFVAIVGHSGCGKSTLLRLLLGFEDNYSGKLCYDNYNLRDIDLYSLRSRIGVVLQNDNLSGESIFSNLNRAGCSENEMWEALKLACVDQDVWQMPMKLHTPVGEGGGNISTGQKQRLILAKALIRSSSILFLDEATSAVDNETQSKIMRNISELSSTKVVVAHRLSTVINSDIIYVFDKGSVVQKGHYKDLLKEDGPFQNIAKRQLI